MNKEYFNCLYSLNWYFNIIPVLFNVYSEELNLFTPALTSLDWCIKDIHIFAINSNFILKIFQVV